MRKQRIIRFIIYISLLFIFNLIYISNYDPKQLYTWSGILFLFVFCTACWIIADSLANHFCYDVEHDNKELKLKMFRFMYKYDVDKMFINVDANGEKTGIKITRTDYQEEPDDE